MRSFWTYDGRRNAYRILHVVIGYRNVFIAYDMRVIRLIG